MLKSVAPEYMVQIGKKIWHNECGCSKENLLFWSPLEPFPSFGIGHFIWYPENYHGPYTQGFPDFIAFVRKHRVAAPSWLDGCCPWPTRDLFYQSMQSPRMHELRTLLETTIDIQAEYMVEELHATIPEIVSGMPETIRDKARAIIDQLLISSQGLYALVDYLNFKGSGLNPKERYNNQGWGIVQVLDYMIQQNLPATSASFALAAEQVLRQRVVNAPPGSVDAQRLPGFLNRIKTYSV
jgi:hypothetical protein